MPLTRVTNTPPPPSPALVEASDIAPVAMHPFWPVTSARGISSQLQAIASALTGPQYLSSQVQSPLRVPVQPFSPGLTPVINQGVQPPVAQPTTGMPIGPQYPGPEATLQPGNGGGILPPNTNPNGLTDPSAGSGAQAQGQSNTTLYVGGALAAGMLWWSLTNKKHGSPKPSLNGLIPKDKTALYVGGAAVAVGLFYWKKSSSDPLALPGQTTKQDLMMTALGPISDYYGATKSLGYGAIAIPAAATLFLGYKAFKGPKNRVLYGLGAAYGALATAFPLAVRK